MTLTPNQRGALAEIVAGQRSSPYYKSLPALVSKGLVVYVTEIVRSVKTAIKKGESEFDEIPVVRYRLTPAGFEAYSKMRRAHHAEMVRQASRHLDIDLAKAKHATVAS